MALPPWPLSARRVADPVDPNAAHAATVNEIRMMLDYITGSPIQTLKDLAIPDPAAALPAGGGDRPLIRNADVLNRLNTLEQKILDRGVVTGEERSFLQLLRDALGIMVRPASGLTIAYTAMVVGNQRSAFGESRAKRAQQAYASLFGPARRHRWGQRILLTLALCFTVIAVAESAQVALGRSILQSVQNLHVQRVAIMQEATRLEQAERQGGGQAAAVWQVGSVKLDQPPMIRLCDRPKVLAYRLHQAGVDLPRLDADSEAMLFDTPAQQDLCDRDSILAKDFRIAHAGLDKFGRDWISMIGPAASLPAHLGHLANCWIASQAFGDCSANQTAVAPEDHYNTDIDVTVEPVLLVLGNYVLPIIFALLGATVYVILDFYSKIRDSLLSPRDGVLSWIRLVLGMVLGACVGLFFTASNPAATTQAGTGLADSITLSASGLAFLAGFGVEGVFGLLDSLVRRVFSGDRDKGGRLSPG